MKRTRLLALPGWSFILNPWPNQRNGYKWEPSIMSFSFVWSQCSSRDTRFGKQQANYVQVLWSPSEKNLYIVHSPTNALLLNLEKFNIHYNTHNYRSYMFRSSTILRELVQSLAKVIFLLKHSVKKFVVVYCVEMCQHVVKWRVCCLLCRLQSVARLRHATSLFLDT